MKKLISLACFLILPFTALLAQGSDSGELPYHFSTFILLVAIVPIVTEALKKMLGVYKYTPDLLIQILSWSVGILLALFGWWVKLGFLADLLWYQALLYGFGASLAANGVADTKLIQKIIELIISFLNKKK
jgi:hypothetical protein